MTADRDLLNDPKTVILTPRLPRFALGLSLGLISGFYGKWVDEGVMRLADVTLAFPSLLLLIALAAAFEPSLTTVLVTIGVVGWAGMARIVRGQVLVVRQLDLDIRRGEFLTLLGPSGSGKTTTLMMLAGVESPTAGDAGEVGVVDHG